MVVSTFHSEHVHHGDIPRRLPMQVGSGYTTRKNLARRMQGGCLQQDRTITAE
jgi:hypothetical protein